MQARGLDVSLVKPTALILFSARLHRDLCEMTDVTYQYHASCSKSMIKALQYGRKMETFLRRFYPVMENIFVLLL